MWEEESRHRDRPWGPPDLGLLSLQAVKNKCVLFKPPSLCTVFCYSSPASPLGSLVAIPTSAISFSLLYLRTFSGPTGAGRSIDKWRGSWQPWSSPQPMGHGSWWVNAPRLSSQPQVGLLWDLFHKVSHRDPSGHAPTAGTHSSTCIWLSPLSPAPSSLLPWDHSQINSLLPGPDFANTETETRHSKGTH